MSEIRVKIGADTSELEDGLKQADREMGRLGRAADGAGRGLKRFGAVAEDLGGKLSIVSAGIGAVTAAAFAMVKGTADSARELQRFAQVSNTSTREFQRLAAGARTVGIEQDKLADIFKDVNDRVGDFLSTGGGPMADFFENIAPQVGVTADEFARLSGPEALQLYVSSLEKAGLSQQEMTFYLEAMASDATALIPLLRNGGAEMQRFGDAAEASGALMDDTAIASAKEFNTSLGNLMAAFKGIKDQFAVTLMPIFTSIMDGITANVIPYLQMAVDKIGEWSASFQTLSPEVQAAVGTIVAAFGVGGPVLLAIGKTAAALASMLAFLGPAGLIAVAVAGGIAAWQVWGDDVTAIIETINAKLDTLLTKALQAIGLGEQAAAIQSGAAAGQTMFGPGIPGMIGGVAGAIQGALGIGTLPGDQGQGAAMSGGMGQDQDASLGTTMGAQIGTDMADGLVLGFQAELEAQRAAIAGAALIAEEASREGLESNSPSKVFERIGQDMGLGMAIGVADSQGLVKAAVDTVGQTAITSAQGTVRGILGAMQQLFQGSKPLAVAMALLNTWQGMTEALKLPFPKNLIAAAQTLATGMNAVKNIKSTTPSGGGAASSAGGASSARSAGASAASSAGASPAQSPVTTFQFTLTNDPFGFGENFARQFVDQLNQTSRNGGQIRGIIA